MARRADVTVAVGSRRAGIELLARRASGVRVRGAGAGSAREGARRVGGVDAPSKVAPRRFPLCGEAPREPGVLELLVERAPVRQLAAIGRLGQHANEALSLAIRQRRNQSVKKIVHLALILAAK